MTKDQAYRLLGIKRRTPATKMEQAYKEKLQPLQRKLLTGHNLAIRQSAQKELTALASAWEVVRGGVTGSAPSSDKRRPDPVTTPGRCPATFSWRDQTGKWMDAMAQGILPKPMVVISLIVSGLLLLSLVLSCFQTPPGKPEKGSTPLQIVSVPPCQVEIDGKPMGDSNRNQPYLVSAGSHQITCRQNRQSLSKQITFRPDRRIMAKVRWEKGQIEIASD